MITSYTQCILQITGQICKGNSFKHNRVHINFILFSTEYISLPFVKRDFLPYIVCISVSQENTSVGKFWVATVKYEFPINNKKSHSLQVKVAFFFQVSYCLYIYEGVKPNSCSIGLYLHSSASSSSTKPASFSIRDTC